MSAFRPRGPNVSQYLRQLNTVNTPQESASILDDGFPDDLALFTNNVFFDVDNGTNIDLQSHPDKLEGETPVSEHAASASTSASTTMDDYSSMDFVSGAGDYSFPDFGMPYTTPTSLNFQDNLTSQLQSIQPSPQSMYPAPPQQHHQPQQNGGFRAPPPRLAGGKPGADASSPTTPLVAADPSSRSGNGSGSGSVGGGRHMSLEEASRVAAEEDKRRRNTAASARFRIKKKQREQALEKSAKELNDKMMSLENRISELETENKFLRNIVVEKNPNNPEIIKLFGNLHSGKKDGKSSSDAAEAAAKAKPRPTTPEDTESGEMTG